MIRSFGGLVPRCLVLDAGTGHKLLAARTPAAGQEADAGEVRLLQRAMRELNRGEEGSTGGGGGEERVRLGTSSILRICYESRLSIEVNSMRAAPRIKASGYRSQMLLEMLGMCKGKESYIAPTYLDSVDVIYIPPLHLLGSFCTRCKLLDPTEPLCEVGSVGADECIC